MARHAICYLEWSSTDLERARRFFGGLFDWGFQPSGEDYLIIETPEGIGGGLTRSDRVAAGSSPLVYVEVDDIDGCLEKVAGLGGAVSMHKTPVLDLGWSAVVSDPDGNLVGLYQGKAESGP